MINRFDQIIAAARAGMPRKLAVAAAQDPEVLRAVRDAKQLGIADAILVGDSEGIRRVAQEQQIDIGLFELIDAPDNTQACSRAVALVARGEAQIVMKGLVDTALLLKAVLDKEAGLRTANVLSHVALTDAGGYGRLFYITDAAMNIAPDVAVKRQIIENAVMIANALGNRNPRVACVCALEKVNPKMAATLDAAKLVELNRNGSLSGCIVGGPLALDNAVSIEAARHKRIADPVAGNADILLMPSIEAGNALYKAISFFARGNIAGIVAGAKAPVVLTSRADSDAAKLNSIAVAVLLANQNSGALA